MKKVLLLIGLLGTIFQTSFGQSDYVITVKGDTLYGAPKILSYDIIDRVELTVDKKKKSYTAREVRSIFMDSITYHSIRHDNRYEYMVLLKSGYLSLYGFRVEKQFTYDGRYLVKLDGEAIELPNIGFKKTMQEFLKNCESVSDLVKSGELGKKHLDSLITLYNSCIDQNSKPTSLPNTQVTDTKVSLPALVALQGKIEQSTLDSKQDVLDLLKDINNKIQSSQAVPNYLIEGLKGYLVKTEFNSDLETLIEALPKK